MLSRSQRLSGEQLDAVMEKGRVAHSSLFLVRALVGQKDTRVAAVASKKIAKTAVGRNSIRRKIYTAVRPIKDVLVTGVHIALFAKAGILQASNDEITNDLKNLFVKVALLR
jgi:ribonuclease P protein component